ncbi:Uncharacterized conserved protein YbjQ, UPF0145 family [Ruaniaceae bacterium KH17]|nr:Uncharacterized conserved protein YbjQ, UPF0145 family [Ruaniaceae bacterium KH17]
MFMTTSHTVEGHPITNYLGLVSGEAVAGINMFKDIGAGFRNLVGGRSQGYEDELIKARESALAEMGQRAQQMGATGVVGIQLDYSSIGDGNMLLVACTGTAVTF